MTAFIDTKVLNGYLKSLKSNGCVVSKDKEALTVEVKDGETVVLRALQKGKGGFWITRLIESDRVKWS